MYCSQNEMNGNSKHRTPHILCNNSNATSPCIQSNHLLLLALMIYGFNNHIRVWNNISSFAAPFRYSIHGQICLCRSKNVFLLAMYICIWIRAAAAVVVGDVVVVSEQHKKPAKGGHPITKKWKKIWIIAFWSMPCHYGCCCCSCCWFAPFLQCSRNLLFSAHTNTRQITMISRHNEPKVNKKEKKRRRRKEKKSENRETECRCHKRTAHKTRTDLHSHPSSSTSLCFPIHIENEFNLAVYNKLLSLCAVHALQRINLLSEDCAYIANGT